MKYDARACHFNMDTGCVELLLRDGIKVSIDCTGVEDALNVTIAQRSEFLLRHSAQIRVWYTTCQLFYLPKSVNLF